MFFSHLVVAVFLVRHMSLFDALAIYHVEILAYAPHEADQYQV
jgi:hypothetical protein